MVHHFCIHSYIWLKVSVISDDIDGGGDRERNNNVDSSQLREVRSTLAQLKLDVSNIETTELTSLIS